MAVQHFSDASVTINSVDLSDHVESVKLTYNQDTLEKTAMGNTEHRFAAGLLDWSVEVVLFQDYASGSVDATCWNLNGAGEVPLVLRPDSGSVAVDNPQYTGNVVSEGYEPISGGVGTLPKVTLRLKAASVLARATS